MARAPLLLLPAILLLDACASSGKAAPEGGPAEKAAKSARSVELARRKVEQSRLEARVESAKHDAAVDQARRELSLAEHALSDFERHESALRLRKAELELQKDEHDFAENVEELEQLKLMYAEQDLADKTRELVLHRTERRIEHSRKQLELVRAQLDHLKNSELGQEREKLAVEVADKRRALAAAELEARVSAGEKAVELLAAEHALADAEAARPGGEAEKEED
jgi:hypothetical protein